MAETPTQPPMPDLRLTCDARIPTNLGWFGASHPCIECDRPVTETINESGAESGAQWLCWPCYTDYLDLEPIPYDSLEWSESPVSKETISKYNLQPHGIQQTLDCGCVLMDMKHGGKNIHLCQQHKICIQPKILMSEHILEYCDECCELMIPGVSEHMDACSTCTGGA
tara:strand:- start:16215 stop:16718 length:504 start_codon:yes stop_codon:yes gene_type:complete